jgi:hypothetical protein
MGLCSWSPWLWKKQFGAGLARVLVRSVIAVAHFGFVATGVGFDGMSVGFGVGVGFGGVGVGVGFVVVGGRIVGLCVHAIELENAQGCV